jgi:hypothetical protein
METRPYLLPNNNEMAAPRLPFLWPMLFRPAKPTRRSTRSIHENASSSVNRPRRSCRQFATTSRKPEETPVQRYGKAHEPAAHLRDTELPLQPEQTSDAKPANPAPEPEPAHDEADEEEAPPPTTTPSTPSAPSAIDAAQLSTKPPEAPKTGDPKPLDSVLHMPSPQDSEHHKPPHLKTPPYVHHFDTYGLVRALTKSTYTPHQSSTLMKAVRGILISNMELAREGLVSKSNVENETYLFRAACSELKTELGNGRKAQMERMRTERAQLQHEVDILGQRLGQETGTLKDELKGLFDDRRMAVRQEQRLMETKVCSLSYIYIYILSRLDWIVVATGSVLMRNADPRTQLQNHCRAQLRCAQRSRGSALGAHAARRHHGWDISVHAVCCAAVHELYSAPAARGEAEQAAQEPAAPARHPVCVDANKL